MTASYSKKHSGYTLIEVLITLFIFVIIVSIISYSFIQILKNTEMVKAKEERLVDIQVAINTLSFDLSQVIPKGPFTQHNNKLHFFKIGNMNPYYQFNRSSIEEVSYQLNNNMLYRISKEDNTADTQKQVLLQQVQAFQCVLFDKNLKQYTLWPPTADWSSNTPFAIQITMVLEDVGMIQKMIEMVPHESIS